MPVFDTNAQQRISNWNRNFDQTVKIILNTTAHPETEQFLTIAKELENIATNLAIETRESDSGLPGFMISDNIFFCAFPMQKELSPFLDAMTQVHVKKAPLPEPMIDQLKQVEIPVGLKLYIALQCPHCPGMVGTMAHLCSHNSNIKVDIIDGSLFTDVAQKDKVMAAPCLILDNDFRWTGSVAAEEIVSMIADRDPSSLSVDSLKNILEQGDAAWITQQMMAKNKIFDNFVSLLLHETWSVRLGAMVIVEELAEDDPGLAQNLCPILINAFDKEDTTVKGDILYALGEAGDMKTVAWIKEQVPQLSHPDLKDAAQDAVESIEERHG